MILEIIFPLLVLLFFSISDFKIGGVKFIFLLSFVFISLLINFFIIHTHWLYLFLSAFIGFIMWVYNLWGSADGYILFGLTTFLGEFYFIFLLSLLFMQVISNILSILIEHISNKKNFEFPYIPFITLGFLYVLPKLIVYNMG